MQFIGIFGGTFDPIHYGHLRPADEVRRALGLDEVRFIPAGQPPHRSAPAASGRHRLEMVRLAIAGHPGLTVDDRELRWSGPSYTVRTLESLRAEPGARTLCLLMGTDAFQDLPTWHRWQRLFDLAHIVVMTRPGAADVGPQAGLPDWARPRLCAEAQRLREQAAGLVYFQGVVPQPISARAIRAAIAAGEPVEHLLPPAVWDYIHRHRLYYTEIPVHDAK